MSVAEEAWVEYRDNLVRYLPRRQLRKREFLAGWEARERHHEAQRLLALAEGAHVSELAWSHIRGRRIVQAVRTAE